MPKEELITAQYLSEREGIELDQVFIVANRYGMDTKNLYPDDVARIKRELSPRRKGRKRKPSLDEGEVVTDIQALMERGKELIVCIRNPETNRSRYMFAVDMVTMAQRPFNEDVSFDDFVDQIETVEEGRKKRKRKIDNDNKPEGDKPEGGRNTKPKKPKPQITIDPKLYQYLMDRQDEFNLRDLLEVGDDEYPTNITHSNVFLTKIVGDETLSMMKDAKLEVKAYTPEAMMTKARKERSRRISSSIDAYLRTPRGRAFDKAIDSGFNADWNSCNDIANVISWLENSVDKEELEDKGLAFYVNCIKKKLKKKTPRSKNERERENTLFSAWVMGASQYEFVQNDEFASEYLRGKNQVDADDLSLEVIAKFRRKKTAKPRNAAKILGGLCAAGKIKNGDLQRVEFRGSNVAYLLSRYDEIGEVASIVIDRMKNGMLVPDENTANNRLYAEVAESKYVIDSREQARRLGRAITAQLTDQEKDTYFPTRVKYQMKTKGVTAIEELLSLYVEHKGPKILKK